MFRMVRDWLANVSGADAELPRHDARYNVRYFGLMKQKKSEREDPSRGIILYFLPPLVGL